MKNLLDTFRYHLETEGEGFYPSGSPCLFVNGEKWEHLCHNISNSKAHKQLLKRAYGSSDLIDLPLLNVVPGSREANMGFKFGYSRTIILCPEPVIWAAIKTLKEHSRVFLNNEKMCDLVFDFEDCVNVTPEKMNEFRARYSRLVQKAINPNKVF